MKRYFDPSDQDLRRYLDRIRQIASMNDEDALPHVDRLLHDLSILSDTDVLPVDKDELLLDDIIETGGGSAGISIDFAKQEIRWFREDLERFRKAAEHHFPDLRIEVELLGSDWPDPIREELHQELQQTIREAYQVADEIDIRHYSQVLRAQARKRKIHNQQSVRRLLEILSKAEEELEKRHALKDDLLDDLRHGRERCAWFRANKKLSQMQLAEQAGRRNDAARLKREAQAILKHDWREAFPGEECPTINQLY